MRVRRKCCDECGERLVPVVYGMPSAKMFLDAERGKVVLGGCMFDGIQRTACPVCRYK